MADQRRANPAYALEVDEMILEYLLYKTTKAFLDAFRSYGTHHANGDSLKAESAASLLQVFDQFLQLFKANHPDCDFLPELNFNFKLLEFTVLFTQRNAPQAFSSSLRDQLKKTSQQNAATRMKWWTRGRRDDQSSTAEHTIIACWRDYFTLPPSTSKDLKASLQIDAAKVIFLVELLPRFLDLSADMAVLLGQDVSEQWMRLAAEFMLQSAWEKHAYLASEASDEPLKVAFGWGQWDRREELDDTTLSAVTTAAEVHVDAMFRTFDGSPEQAAGQDIPAWSKIKLEYLSAFGTTPAGVNGVHHGERWQVKRLKEISERFPKLRFHSKMADYIEDFWKLGRKPVLVQIEEGRIEGLMEKDFKDLKENLGVCGNIKTSRW